MGPKSHAHLIQIFIPPTLGLVLPQASEPETCCHIASAERKLRSPWHFDIRCISTFCPPSASNILWVRAPLRFCSTSCCTLPKGETTEATKKIAKFVWLQTSPGLSECNLLRISLAQPDGVERMRALGKRGAVAASSFLQFEGLQVRKLKVVSFTCFKLDWQLTAEVESLTVPKFHSEVGSLRV